MKSLLQKCFFILVILCYAAFAQAEDNSTQRAENPSLMYSWDNASYYNNFIGPIQPTEELQDNMSAIPPPDPCGYENVNLVPYRKQYINLLSENDAYFNAFTDRYYTAGNRIGYTSKEEDYYCQNVKHSIDPEYKRSKLWWLSKISVLQGRRLTRWDISVAQEMYTPKNKLALISDENDYPYAGYLYLSLGFSNRDENTEERFKLHLGMVGPAALAQYTQDFIHTVFGLGSKLPWDSQIDNEPIFNLHYQITKKYYLFNTPYISSDILPGVSAALGNANIYVAASLRLRIGYNLDADFGVSKINHATDNAPPHSDKFSIYVFGGAGGRFVIKNIFISGNTFQKGTNLDITRLVYDLEAGVAIMAKGIRISYTFSHRSKEFKNQSNFMNFSSIALQIAF